jgi:hypothetical protein
MSCDLLAERCGEKGTPHLPTQALGYPSQRHDRRPRPESPSRWASSLVSRKVSRGARRRGDWLGHAYCTLASSTLGTRTGRPRADGLGHVGRLSWLRGIPASLHSDQKSPAPYTPQTSHLPESALLFTPRHSLRAAGDCTHRMRTLARRRRAGCARVRPAACRLPADPGRTVCRSCWCCADACSSQTVWSGAGRLVPSESMAPRAVQGLSRIAVAAVRMQGEAPPLRPHHAAPARYRHVCPADNLAR